MKNKHQPKGINCEICIRLLLDKNALEADRMAATESLSWCNSASAQDALFQVILDEEEMDHLREEAAASLGSLWTESGIDYSRLAQIPERFYPELTHDFGVLGIKWDKFKR
ncbi:MAG: hypothetical protein H6581_17085 [Bacteroidia bacterium]|nr:hypothetical protein [Bacteroidia bacterium]